MPDTCIVGAGVSGLTLAYCLAHKGSDLFVQDNGGRAGGAIRTAVKNGYLLEYGPNSVRAPGECPKASTKTMCAPNPKPPRSPISIALQIPYD